MAGVVSIICAIGSVLDAYLDNDPKTMPNWNLTGSALATGLGLIFAVDDRRLREHEKDCCPEVKEK